MGACRTGMECRNQDKRREDRPPHHLSHLLSPIFHGMALILQRCQKSLVPAYRLSSRRALKQGYYTNYANLVLRPGGMTAGRQAQVTSRSEEHTSELQSRREIVCR